MAVTANRGQPTGGSARGGDPGQPTGGFARGGGPGQPTVGSARGGGPGQPTGGSARAGGSGQPTGGSARGGPVRMGGPGGPPGGPVHMGGSAGPPGGPVHTGGPGGPPGGPVQMGGPGRPSGGPVHIGGPGRPPGGPVYIGRPGGPLGGPVRWHTPGPRPERFGYYPRGFGRRLVGPRYYGWGRGRWLGYGRRWPWFYRSIWRDGLVSPTVAWAQTCLAQLLGPRVPQDGIMGPGTREAIEQFQMQQQLPPTGILDDNTVGALQAVCSAQQEEALLAGEIDESEGETTKDAMLIAFKIPEAPYSDELFERIHKSIDLFEAVHTTMEIFEVPLAGLLGLSVTALAPLITWVGGFFALGAAYAKGRATVARQRIRSGFALGVVTGANPCSWSDAKSLFWEYAPESNTFDPDAGRIGQQAFNTGLAAGFLQGREIARNRIKKDFFWKSLGATLTRGDLMEFAGDPKLWPRRLWIAWFIRAEASFINLWVKD